MTAFSRADGEWVVWKTVVRIDDMTIVYETGFLLGDEMILVGKLVTKRLNEVVFGRRFTLEGFDGLFLRLDGLLLCGDGGVHDAGNVYPC